MVVRTKVARSRATAAVTQTATPSRHERRRAAEKAVTVAERGRTIASDAVDYHTAIYESANAVVAETRLAAARAERLREHARTTVAAAVAARQQARAARDAGRVGLR